MAETVATVAQGKCTMRSAPTAAQTAKFLSNQRKDDQFTAGTASRSTGLQGKKITLTFNNQLSGKSSKNSFF